MANFMAYTENPLLPTDRRRYVRKPVGTLAYVELDEGNGGIVLNVSEGGLSVQAVTSLMDDVLPRVRFQLTQSPHWIETSARVTWATESRKLAGLEFIDLSDRARGEIRKWLNGEEPSDEARQEENSSSDFPVTAETESVAVATATAIDVEPSSIHTGFVPTEAEEPAADRVAENPEEPTTFSADAAASDAAPSASRATIPSFGYSSSYQSAPKQARDFKFTIGESASPAGDEPKSHDIRTVSLFVGFLALVSLLAGWAAGHGTVGKLLGKMRSTQASRPEQAATVPATPAARISEIEVVNLNNQRWTIPFDNPPGTSQQGERTGITGSVRESPRPAPGFNTWVLSPPVRSAQTAGGNTVQPEPPPTIVPETSPGPESGPASPLVANSVALQSVVPKPEVRQSAGVVKRGDLIHRVEPVYPVLAREQRMEGTVRLNVSISEDGLVRKVTVLGGPPLLLQAAADAVKQWKYAPTTLDGRPIESEREVSLVFHL